jgi:hypothetical protein
MKAVSSHVELPLIYVHEYSVTISKDVIKATQWCMEHYGTYPGKRWSKAGLHTFVFNKSKDATWFALRWQ